MYAYVCFSERATEKEPFVLCVCVYEQGGVCVYACVRVSVSANQVLCGLCAACSCLFKLSALSP